MESKYHLVTSCSCSSVAEGKFDYSKEGINAGFSVGVALRLGSSFSLSYGESFPEIPIYSSMVRDGNPSVQDTGGFSSRRNVRRLFLQLG